MTKHTPWAQFAASIAVAVTMLMAGNSKTWFTIYPGYLMEGDPFYDTELSIIWTRIIYFLGCCASPIPAGLIMDRVGKKLCLLMCAVLIQVSWVIVFFSKTTWILKLSRLICGVAVGMSVTVSPFYVSEIATPHLRGSCILILRIMFNIGGMYTNCIARGTSFRFLALANLIFPIPSILILSFVPESPYYLFIRDKEDDAYAALLKLRGSDNLLIIHNEFYYIQKWVQMHKREGLGFKILFCNRVRRLGFLIVLAILLTYHLAGMSVISGIAQDDFIELSDSPFTLDQIIIILDAMKIGTSAFSAVVVDKVGRRVLFLSSAFGTSFFLFILGIYVILHEETSLDLTSFNFVPVTCTLLSNVMFEAGLAFLPMLLVSELIPFDVQGVGGGICNVVFYFVNFIGHFFALRIKKRGATTLLFSVLGACSAIAVFFILPETKQKSLAALSRQFDKSSRLPVVHSRKTSGIPGTSISSQSQISESSHTQVSRVM